MTMTQNRGRVAAFCVTLALLAFGAAACSDEHPIIGKPPVGGGGGADETPPRVDLLFPNAETGTVAVGDSLFVRVRVRDGSGVSRVLLEGFARRGDRDLGTEELIPRFEAKEINLAAAGRTVTDTTLNRYLLPTADSLAEVGVLVVATAWDAANNMRSDTILVNVGGPRIRIVEPAPGAEPRGGTQITVRVAAEDPVDLITGLTIRTSGAFTTTIPISLGGAVVTVDTSVVIPIPAAATGHLRIDASAMSGTNQAANSVPVNLTVRPSEADAVPPRTTFTTQVPRRMEHGDSLSVSVSAVDETRVDSVGVTILAMRRRAGGGRDTLAVMVGRRGGESATFPFGLAALGLNARDTATVELEVTAWAKDPNGNCGAATSPNTPQSLACIAGPQGSRLSSGAGRLETVFVARGTTVRRPNAGDVIADLVADSSHVFMSNMTRNRVEVLPIGTTTFAQPVVVGAQPWGLALGRTRDTLFVANSGGTNISAIPVRSGLPFREDQGARIFTPNEVLYEVRFSETMEPGEVIVHDYSDRPQFIAQTSAGHLIYSTRPTGAAPDGTIQIYDPAKRNQEIFTGYVRNDDVSGGIVVNARSAGLVPGPTKQLSVCVRRRFGDTTDPPCFVGFVDEVATAVNAMRNLPPNVHGVRYDTRVDIYANIADVGLSDTTFVAVSGDRSTVAFGEGARLNARIPVFTVQGSELRLTGNLFDLINNTNERVIGLGLNYDGSLGVARGFGTYYFDRQARLQGTTAAATPAGGVAMHPDNRGYPGNAANRVSFVSGKDAADNPYIDVFDTFNFLPVRRIYLRDPVIGAIAVAPRGPGDPANVAHRLYAITSGGIVAVEVLTTDLRN
jgi:hypothetical protein